jgi:hypothetical protein
MKLSTRDRRLLIGVAVVAVLGLGVFVVKGRLHKGTPAAPPVAAAPHTSGGSSTGIAPSPSPVAGQQPAAARSPKLVFTGRDPFVPLIVAATSPVSGGSSPTVSPAGSASSAPGGGSSQTIGGHTVVLDDIFTDNGVQKAQVEVDGTVYTVAPGDSFASSYQLVSISGTCGDFLFGDQSFTLCETSNK